MTTTDINIIRERPDQTDEKGLDLQLKEQDLRKQAKSARDLFNTIQDELDQHEEDIKDGLSFLDMKNDTLLSYMIDVCNIVLLKVRGESIENHQSVERCIEYRVILEKIKAVDQKLAYQLNKLITLPEDAEEESQNINVANLDIDVDDVESEGEISGSEAPGNDDGDEDDDISEGGAESVSNDDTDNDDDEEEEEDDLDGNGDGDDDLVKGGKRSSKSKKSPPPTKSGVKQTGVYKPPKLRSVAYTEESDRKRGDKGRRRDYNEFYQDEETGDIIEGARASKEEKERIRFEEDNYTRLPDENPKKTKRKLKTKEYRKKSGKRLKRRR